MGAGFLNAQSIDTRRARRSFDRAAKTYLGAARLEQEVGARMLERLDYVKLAPQRILDAGAGPAPQCSALLARYREAQLVALDFSLPMLQQISGRGLLRRLIGAPAPQRLCADLARIPLAAGTCSLVWSNMALHWVEAPLVALREFYRVLAVGGLVMFSTLGPDTLKELRSAFAAGNGAEHVHRFTDMHDLGDMLVAAGFAAPVMDMEILTLTYAGVEGLVRDLRGSGQTNSLASRARGLFGAQRWRAVRAALAGLERDGRLPITVEVLYGHAWKDAPRRTAQGHAIVQLDRRRRMRG